ncbi:glyoxalase [Stenotrophomonas pictorum JCM 9942]|jgi:catechol 2,3-dioxygenase-like lactoylglutathione lyase family enzyme|uniref:Glyoxalase n=1 Tax=Stenotrophomonas pictorum JCM 9942 TaxID=1236960 RepID=A0A0R0A8U3_9GAMM|nr:VOC family protein [Stenotrophomonas pictorum]KRG41499.1 glyoxalase [Stenotrophomonas pictorum JCM 9942]
MFSHIVVGANDITASRRFYDAVLAALGGKPGLIDPKGNVVYRHQGALLIVGHPRNGEPATPANGGTIGFTCGSPGDVDAWHAAGVDHGGTSIEDPPGLRQTPFGPLYLAYLRDPAGNKLCAAYHPAAATA